MSNLSACLTEIDSLKQRLDALRPLNNLPLQQAMDIEYTYESNRIEGNTLTLRETDLVVNKGLTVGGKSMREHLEAINHYEAVLYIRDMVTQQVVLTETVVRDLHALVLRGIDRDNAGRYRTVPVRISGSRYEPPQPWAVPELMTKYGLWLLSQEAHDLHPVVWAAEAHERLVTIHPFIDGNGRTSRLVMNIILLQHGYPIANIPGDTQSRLSYYEALETTNLSGDHTRFVELMAAHVLSSTKAWVKTLGGV